MMDMVRGGGGGLSMFDGLMKRKERSERNPLTDKQRADQRKAERKRKKRQPQTQEVNDVCRSMHYQG